MLIFCCWPLPIWCSSLWTWDESDKFIRTFVTLLLTSANEFIFHIINRHFPGHSIFCITLFGLRTAPFTPLANSIVPGADATMAIEISADTQRALLLLTPAHIHFLYTILSRFCWDTGWFNRDAHPAAAADSCPHALSIYNFVCSSTTSRAF